MILMGRSETDQKSFATDPGRVQQCLQQFQPFDGRVIRMVKPAPS
jgi:hypothetical protein